MVEPGQTQRDYPIPAAFGAYARYLQIYLGQEKYAQEKSREEGLSI